MKFDYKTPLKIAQGTKNYIKNTIDNRNKFLAVKKKDDLWVRRINTELKKI